MDLGALVNENLISLIALGIALGGLALSIYNTIIQRKERQPIISLEFFYLDVIEIENYPFDGYVILTKNLGKVAIIIDTAGIKWDNDKYEINYYGSIITDEYQSFPYKLEPGSTHRTEFGRSEIQREISKSSFSGPIEIKGLIKDGEGRYYFSPSLEITIQPDTPK